MKKTFIPRILFVLSALLEAENEQKHQQRLVKREKKTYNIDGTQINKNKYSMQTTEKMMFATLSNVERVEHQTIANRQRARERASEREMEKVEKHIVN